MFCKNCGAEIPDGSQFCAKCGSSIETSPTVAQQANIVPAGLRCPKCGSKSLQAIVESNTTGTGGGYSGGKGCLGFLLFGPLGLLCGSCGSKQKISTTNKTFWVCQNCGNKFRNAKDLMDESSRLYKGSRVGTISFAILTIVALIGSIAMHADTGSSLGFIMTAIVFVIAALFFVVFRISKSDYNKAKAEYESYSQKA